MLIIDNLLRYIFTHIRCSKKEIHYFSIQFYAKIMDLFLLHLIFKFIFNTKMNEVMILFLII